MKLPFSNGGQIPAKLHWYWKSLMQVHCKKWIATSIYLLCAVSYCGFKPTFPHVLIFIVKSLIGNTKLVHTPNGLGDSALSLYSAGVDWHSTVSPLDYKIELSADDIPLPGNIYPAAFTTLLYGNIKHLEKTASGETSHVVNDIAFQANFNGPECRQPIPEKKTSIRGEAQAPTPQILLVLNAGHRVGPSKTQLETPNAAANHSPLLADFKVQD